MGRPSKYPDELWERAVRMAAEVRPQYPSQWAAITAVAGMLGIGTPETLRTWIRRGEVIAGTWLCCVVGSGVRLTPFWCRSDGECQLIERRPDSMLDCCLSGDLVVAAPEVLNEGMTGSKHPY